MLPLLTVVGANIDAIVLVCLAGLTGKGFETIVQTLESEAE